MSEIAWSARRQSSSRSVSSPTKRSAHFPEHLTYLSNSCVPRVVAARRRTPSSSSHANAKRKLRLGLMALSSHQTQVESATRTQRIATEASCNPSSSSELPALVGPTSHHTGHPYVCMLLQPRHPLLQISAPFAYSRRIADDA
jgi:hypothetical protein